MSLYASSKRVNTMIKIKNDAQSHKNKFICPFEKSWFECDRYGIIFNEWFSMSHKWLNLRQQKDSIG